MWAGHRARRNPHQAAALHPRNSQFKADKPNAQTLCCRVAHQANVIEGGAVLRVEVVHAVRQKPGAPGLQWAFEELGHPQGFDAVKRAMLFKVVWRCQRRDFICHQADMFHIGVTTRAKSNSQVRVLCLHVQ